MNRILSGSKAIGQEAFDLEIGVITGGISEERDRSLLSGETVHKCLLSQGYRVQLIDAAAPDLVDQVKKIDVAFLAIAGQYAEDGKLQGLLETLNIRYTGSGVLASSLGMSKTTLKTLVAALGVPVLGHVQINPADSPEIIAKHVGESVGFPVMVKPVSEGGSVGMSIARTAGELHDFVNSLDGLADHRLFAERYCTGRSLTVGVLDGPDGLQPLPPLEAKTVGDFYDYETKRDPALHRYECPASISAGTREEISRIAVDVHETLGCIGYSRSDFVVDDDGNPYFLEVNTLPGLSRTGNLAVMAEADGITYDDLVKFILGTALAQKGYVA